LTPQPIPRISVTDTPVDIGQPGESIVIHAPANISWTGGSGEGIRDVMNGNMSREYFQSLQWGLDNPTFYGK
jgi:hypothetical protein